MKQVKAIETEYNGYRFRSRLEARWAVFFDAANIKYEYETEGFKNRQGERYLPDFYLPDYGWHVEVKAPRKEAIDDLRRASHFVGETINVLLLLGDIPYSAHTELFHHAAMFRHPLTGDVCIQSVCFSPAYEEDVTGRNYCFELRADLAVDYETIIPVYPLLARSGGYKILTAIDDTRLYAGCRDGMRWADAFDEDTMRYVKKCYQFARQARFEYGEKG